MPAFASDLPVLTTQGLGPYEFGMSREQLSAAAGRALEGATALEDPRCHYIQVPELQGVLLMMVNGRLARIDVRTRGVATVGGVRVGDRITGVRRKLGQRLHEEPSKYSADTGGLYLELKLSSQMGLRFETHGDRISQFYLGRLAQVDWVEGCS